MTALNHISLFSLFYQKPLVFRDVSNASQRAVTDPQFLRCIGQFPGDIFHDIEEISKFLLGLVLFNDILSLGNLTLGCSRLQFMLCSSLVTINWVEHLDLDTIA